MNEKKAEAIGSIAASKGDPRTINQEFMSVVNTLENGSIRLSLKRAWFRGYDETYAKLSAYREES